MSHVVFPYLPGPGGNTFAFRPSEADLLFYREVSLQLNVQPSSPMFRYTGPRGSHLSFIGERGCRDWARVMRFARMRWPDLPTAGKIASDGRQLGSVAERAFYETIIAVKPADVTIDVEQPLDERQPDGFRSDLGIRFKDRITHVEIVGACGSDEVTRNAAERHMLGRFHRRQKLYRKMGIKPVVLYLDMLIDPPVMRERFHAIVAALRAGGL